ncbi:MAG: hypothetical protein H0W33_10900 [Gammaproteobacteria bacterium]|nr:hypothetical protein [Gammaproteobacteria bacterium]
MNDQLARKLATGIVVLCAVAALSACNEDDKRFTASIAAAQLSASDGRITITGKPGAAVVQNTQYDFQPQADSIRNVPLRFSVTGKPTWATFERHTGRLSGMPSEGDVGQSDTVQIAVSDGSSTVALPAFEVVVVAYGESRVTLGWQPPTSNEDGTPLTDLAGHRIYWGTIKGEYPNSIEIDNPGVATYVVDNLVPNTYYFVTTAFSSRGMESGHSNVARATVN